MDIAALLADLPDDGEPEPGFVSDGDKEEDDATIVLNNWNVVVQLEEELGGFLPLISGEDLLESPGQVWRRRSL